jgi:paraquat-inducible protein B
MPSANPTAVGAFVLGALGIIVAAVLFFGSGDILARRTKAVVFFEGSVGGLEPGAAVTFRGVRVGSVSKVVVIVDSNDMKARIPVYLELEPNLVTFASGDKYQPVLHGLIAAGLRAKLESQSLVTGQMLVELDLSPGTPAHFVGTMSDVPEIPAVPSDLQQLRDQLTQAPIAETVTQAQHTLAALERVADHVDSELGPLSAGARSVLDNAGQTLEAARSSIQRVDTEAATTLTGADGLIHDGRQQLAARGQELSQTLADAERALQSVDTLARSANGLIDPHSQPRADIEAMLRDLAASSSALRDFAQTVERNPSTLLRGRAPR